MFRIRIEQATELARLRRENNIMAAALESERQWRLNSLPALLDAERRANVAELERDQYAARVDELMAELAQVKRSLYRLPWLSPVTEPGGRP